jgi:acetyl/propionyl-CoA carboxylase alpha subunit
MFSTLLIANRGEIARRIMRTAGRLGIKTVAVYSDADAEAAFVEEADQAVRIGPPPASESYLRIDAILEAAARTGAEAIHPGYGFLSENGDFAEACAKAGIVFVGPSAEAIRAMGLKDRAKTLMAAAGVPVTPGYHGEDQSDATLTAAAAEIGYPVLVKAIAGGGGKGMRGAASAAELPDALKSARREAKSAFSDDRVLIEKLIASPRHIEVQVFGDAHGDVIHLFERDCSLQRRRQKVIEEAPAPGMTARMRAALCDAAVKAAKAVGYVNAGTVEFIVDGRKGLKPDAFWFMEMNTRLQVEHPVTEMITGLDLVELQLRVAAGEALPPQKEITFAGHAIEARIYAEDPETGFLPSTGPLETFDLESLTEDWRGGGEQADGILRLDSGVEQGDVVRPYYDPMLAKAIAHARSREDAALKLGAALAQGRVWPVRTNLGFLVRALSDRDFLAGGVSTSFIDDRIDMLATSCPPEDVAMLGALVEAMEQDWVSGRAGDPWDARDGFRLNAPPRWSTAFELKGRRWNASVTRHGQLAYVLKAGDRERRAGIILDDIVADEGELVVRLDDEEAARCVGFERTRTEAVVWVDGDAFALARPRFEAAAVAEAGDEITAPMPGRVVEVRVKARDGVAAGQVLAVLEAMKMEHALKAPRAGVVADVRIAAGEQASLGAVLVRLEPVEKS